MLDIIWGMKTTAMLDVWTIEHVLSGVSVGHLVFKRNKSIFQRILTTETKDITQHFDIVAVLFVAYLWETFEHYLETGLAGEFIEYWFQGVEFWPNRLIFDPLMLVCGYLIAKRYPQFVVPARVISIIWLFTHLFIFPHSMYLHEIL